MDRVVNFLKRDFLLWLILSRLGYWCHVPHGVLSLYRVNYTTKTSQTYPCLLVLLQQPWGSFYLSRCLHLLARIKIVWTITTLFVAM